ncbi:MAG: succinate dehydrogenase assembly factor 2 [Pseudomonadota bacterium]
MPETREIRLKRLRMRSMRRGIKEMDLLLLSFADNCMAELSEAELERYDALLEENDQDLYEWVSGQSAPPEGIAALIEIIRKNYENSMIR